MREEEPIIVTPAQGLDVGGEQATDLVSGGQENKNGVVVTPPTPTQTYSFSKKDIEEISLKATEGKRADLVGGKVPADQLPSYVDDVLEFEDLAHFPSSGEQGKIYLALDTGYTYRWSGTQYVRVNDRAESVNYLTTAPSAANTDGLKVVVLSAEPATKYDGYLYLIEEE